MLRGFDLKRITERAEQGDWDAILSLGLAYQLGWGENGENVDFERALFWLTKAKEQRPNEGCYYLGCLFYDYLEEPEKALEQWEEGAKLDHIGCISRLEFHYSINGELGSRRAAEKAACWSERGALLGEKTMMMNIGNYYASGRGVKKDPELACFWWATYIKSGGLNPSSALRSLSKAYLLGKGVRKKKPSLAAYLWIRAWLADREFEWEKRELNWLLIRGRMHYGKQIAQEEEMWKGKQSELAFEKDGGLEADEEG